jgi:hypothetical protein
VSELRRSTPSHYMQILHGAMATSRPLTYRSPGHARALKSALDYHLAPAIASRPPASKHPPRLTTFAVLLCRSPTVAAHGATPVRNSHPVAIRHPSPSLSLATALPVPETSLKLHAFVNPKLCSQPALCRRLTTPSSVAALSLSPKSPRIPLHMSSPTMLTASEDRTQAVRPVP